MTGALLELISRGKKDVYCFSQPSSQYYSKSYLYTPPIVWSTSSLPPKNAPRWGSIVEFDLNPIADLVNSFRFHIYFPSVESATGFGYVDAPAIYMFDWIEVYSDSTLIQRLTPTALDLWFQRGYWSSDYRAAATETSKMVARRSNAIPNPIPTFTYVHSDESDIHRKCILPLPILGCNRQTDPPFPMRCATASQISIRARIKSLKSMLESYPVAGVPFTIPVETFARGPDINLVYDTGFVSVPVRDTLLKTRHSILIEHIQTVEFPIEKTKLVSAVAVGGVDIRFPRIDIKGPVKMLSIITQTASARNAHQYAQYQSPSTYLSSINLITNAHERFYMLDPYYYMDAGWTEGTAGMRDAVFNVATNPEERSPTGTLYFNTKEKCNITGQLIGTVSEDRIYIIVNALGYTTIELQNGKAHPGVVPSSIKNTSFGSVEYVC